ncbi:MAG: hypothetical protein IJY28_00880 [Clostridia bacterium]|nr:hypothetical protein [Clostridia bacterium]
MNQIELNAFLNSYQAVRDELRQLTEQLARLKSRMQLSGSGLNGMPHSSGIYDRVGDGVARMDELRMYYLEKSAEADRIHLQIEKLIASLPPDERCLMRDRHILGLKWESIAERHHYSERHARRMHRDILCRLADKT